MDSVREASAELLSTFERGSFKTVLQSGSGFVDFVGGEMIASPLQPSNLPAGDRDRTMFRRGFRNQRGDDSADELIHSGSRYG